MHLNELLVRVILITGGQESAILPFISTYKRNNPNIFNDIISQARQSLGLMDAFKNHWFIKAFRQSKSLLRILNNNEKVKFNRITS